MITNQLCGTINCSVSITSVGRDYNLNLVATTRPHACPSHIHKDMLWRSLVVTHWLLFTEAEETSERWGG